jgi:hypothetical protein
LEDDTQPDSCVVFKDSAEWHNEDVWQPDAPPQPELMNGVQAMVKAVNQGGGEIWNEKSSPDYRLTVDAEGNVTKGRVNLEYKKKWYTVRPLPPADFDFAEALECLKRGEKVQVIGDGQIIVLVPEIGSTLAGYGIKFSFLKDKRFRKA